MHMRSSCHLSPREESKLSFFSLLHPCSFLPREAKTVQILSGELKTDPTAAEGWEPAPVTWIAATAGRPDGVALRTCKSEDNIRQSISFNSAHVPSYA